MKDRVEWLTVLGVLVAVAANTYRGEAQAYYYPDQPYADPALAQYYYQPYYRPKNYAQPPRNPQYYTGRYNYYRPQYPSVPQNPYGAYGAPSQQPVPAETPEIPKEEVRVVQEQLSRLGYDPGPADGVLGRKTVSALATFQHEQRIYENGTIGEQTRTRLAQMIGKLARTDPIGNSVLGKLIQLDELERGGPPESADPFYAKRAARRVGQGSVLNRREYMASERSRTP